MYKRIISAFLLILFFTGCASVPMASKEESDYAKKFNQPTNGKSGLYIYRSGSFGCALKKDIWINDECVGESASNVFFYTEVDGDKEHKVSTESEFSPNDLIIKVKSGFNYFIKQYIKMGLFVGGANLKVVDETKGKEDVLKLGMAQKGHCTK